LDEDEAKKKKKKLYNKCSNKIQQKLKDSFYVLVLCKVVNETKKKELLEFKRLFFFLESSLRATLIGAKY
jgi:translation initiation factor 2 beta subunit (eIF-2beta)/eIF-5